MIDQGIGAEVGGGTIGKAETDGDDGDAGGLCRGGVGDRIADEDGAGRVTAGGGDGGVDMAGVGLGSGDRIKAEIGGKAAVPAEGGDEGA